MLQALTVRATQIFSFAANDKAQRLTPEMIAESLKRAPRRLSNLVKQIKIHDMACPSNSYWQQSTGQSDFQAFATADTARFVIEFWANSHLADPTRSLDYVVLHELGHLLDRKLGLRAALKALRQQGRKIARTGVPRKAPKGFHRYYWSEEGTSWSKAMMLDAAFNPADHTQCYISSYAALHNLNREDFADSVALMVQDYKAFARSFPHRYHFLAKKLGIYTRKAH